MTGRQLLEERIAAGRRLERLQEAEVCGLIRASYSPVPFIYSNSDPEIQARWQLGFRERLELLRLDEPSSVRAQEIEEDTHG
jgi:hypothetical protein